jgi:hypothetical protein
MEAMSVFGVVGGISHQVCDAEVHGQRNDCGHEAGPEGACEVCDITDEPDSEEDERDAVCGARLVVFDQLRDLVLLAIRRDDRSCGA